MSGKPILLICLFVMISISFIHAQSDSFRNNSKNLTDIIEENKKGISARLNDDKGIQRLIENKWRYEDLTLLDINCSDQFKLDKLVLILETFPNVKELILRSNTHKKIEFNRKITDLLDEIEILSLRNIEISAESSNLNNNNLKSLFVRYGNIYSSSKDINKDVSNEFDLAFFSSCKNIEELLLDVEDKYSIKNFQEIKQFKGLKTLELNLSGFDAYDKPFKNIRKLNKLRLLSLVNSSHCSLEGIENQNNLEKLILNCKPKSRRNPSVKNLSNNIYQLKKIKEITLHNTNIHSNIGLLTNLKSLTIINNEVDLPSSIKDLKKLEHVDIISSNSRIPLSSFNPLKKLKSLDLTADIREYDNNSKLELPSLKVLELSPMPPSNYSSLQDQELIRQSAGLDSKYIIQQGEAFLVLPKSLEGIKHVEALKIKASFLLSFNLDLKSLIHLKRLKFYTIEDDYEYEELKDHERGLERIYKLRESIFNSLFADLSQCKKLETLDLSYNVMKPEDVKRIINLFSSDLHKNLSIDISNNCLFSLPEMNWNDLNTKCIDISNNFISAYPPSLLNSDYESIKLSEDEIDCGSHYIDRKAEQYLYQFINKEITLKELKNKQSLIDYLLKNTGQETSAIYIDIAYDIDSVYLESQINPIYLARYYFEKKKFYKTIGYYENSDISSKEDNLVDYYIYALSLYKENKIEKAKEVIKKITSKEYAIINRRNNSNTNYIEDYVLSNKWLRYIKVLAISDQKESDKLLSEFIKNKESDIIFDECNKKIGNYLDLLEIYLVSNSQIKYDSLVIEIEREFNLAPRSLLIVNYLNTIKELSEGKCSEENFNRIKNELEQHKEYLSWDPAIAEIWAILENSDNYENISSLNRRIYPVSNYLIWN